MLATRTANQHEIAWFCTWTKRKKLIYKNAEEYVARFSTLSAFIIAQLKKFCRRSRHLAKIPRKSFTLERNGSLVHKSTTDGLTQKLVSRSLRAPMLQWTHYLTVPTFYEELRLWNWLRWGYYWPHVRTNGYKTVEIVVSLHVWVRSSYIKGSWNIFYHLAPHNYYSVIMLGPLPGKISLCDHNGRKQ